MTQSSRRQWASKACQNEFLLNQALGGSWVVLSGVVSTLIWVISIATLLITLLITGHEPPSSLMAFCLFQQLALVRFEVCRFPDNHEKCRGKSERTPTAVAASSYKSLSRTLGSGLKKTS